MHVPLRTRWRGAGATALLLAAFVSLAPQAVPAAAAASPAQATSAEARVLTLINARRTAAGLVPLARDARLASIARGRSTDMATKHYFDHRQPDGRYVFDIMKAAHITWYRAGEVIAWNNWPRTSDSASVAVKGWMASAGHRAILMARDLNYIGIGFATNASGDRYWTGVVMRGPDRSPPSIHASIQVLAGPAGSATRSARITWSGADRRLQVLTAGLRDFQLERRLDGGAWQWVSKSTTARFRTFTVARGHRIEVRVRSRDRRGNASRWVVRAFSG